MFLLNPVVLAYGHIVQSDIGMALAFPLAVWIFARLLETPSGRKAVLAGAAVGLALATKHTAIILAPTFAVLWLLHRRRRKTDWKSILIVPAVAWGMILLLYAPHWSPPPLIDAATAAKLAVPWWLTALRPILIPGEYFKGLALTALHASTGHEAYLNGAWSHSGWWYYFPLAFAMKTPLPFLFFAGAGIAMAVRSRHRIGFVELAAWTGALIYLLCAMPSKTNIGVRHILAVYPLLAIGAACSLSRCINGLQQRRQQFAGLALSVLLAANLGCTLLAYPYFICYLNLLAGGTEHGYEHLLDSNYDWGQDVIRLRKFVDARNISKIYLQYFGTQAAIDYYKIPCEFVDSHAARQIREGYLVISAQALMLPEWEWLRGSRQPSARVGYTLFVYEINPSPRPL
jgi:4-amino-4-deoxy-L-arabinose transferase-like glycosyltransferase